MKYQNQLKQMFIESFNIEIEDEDDWEDFKELLAKTTETTIETLDSQLEDGVAKGHTVEFQIKLIKTIFKTN